MIAAGPETLSLRLLDVPVFLGGHGPALRRLEACYRAAPRGGPGDPAGDAVFGSVEAIAAGRLAVAVTGRPGSVHGDVTAAVRTLNHELLHALMLRRRDLFFLHAGVVSVDGRAVVLPGLSQAGKSTLVLALVLRGARYLTDELLAFDPAAGHALPFLRAPKVRDVCLPWFRTLSSRFSGEGEGRFLPLETLGPDALGGPAAPALFVNPAWASGSDDVPTPLGAGAGLLRLTTAALNFGSHGVRSVDHLAALATAGEHLELRWSDPHRAAARILDRCRPSPAVP